MDPLKIKMIEARPGQSLSVDAHVFDQDGRPLRDRQVVWKSSNPSVAVPEKSCGLSNHIRCKSPGIATITVACDSAFQPFTVLVIPPKPTKINIEMGTLK